MTQDMVDESTATGWLAFDVGNTCIKAGWFQGNALLETCTVPLRRAAATLPVFEQFRSRPLPTRAAIATVNPPASDRLILELGKHSIDVRLVLKSDGRLLEAGFLRHELTTPCTTGIDRLLSAIAARGKAGDRSTLLVTAGSAITVNQITAEGVFRGGAILPGLQLMARSLHQQTAQLPQIIPVTTPPAAVGNSTESALAAGVYYAAVGAVDRLLQEMSRADEKPAVYLTGGDAEALSAGLRTPHRIEPNLVLEGLCAVAQQWDAPSNRQGTRAT